MVSFHACSEQLSLLAKTWPKVRLKKKMRLDATSAALAVSESDGFVHLTLPAVQNVAAGSSDNAEDNGGANITKLHSCAVVHIELERNGGLCIDLVKSGETLYSVLISLASWITSVSPSSDSASLQAYETVIQYIVKLIRNSIAGFRFQKLAFFEHHLDEALCSLVLDERSRRCMSKATLNSIALCTASLLRCGSSAAACLPQNNNNIESMLSPEPSSSSSLSTTDENEAELKQLHRNIHVSKLLECVRILLHSLSSTTSDADRQQKRIRETLLTALGQFYYSSVPPTTPLSARTIDSGCWTLTHDDIVRAPPSSRNETSKEEELQHAGEQKIPRIVDETTDTSSQSAAVSEPAVSLLVTMIRQLSTSEPQQKASAACTSRLISMLAYACLNESNAQLLLRVLPGGIRVLLELTRSPPAYNVILENCLFCVLRLVLCCETTTSKTTLLHDDRDAYLRPLLMPLLEPVHTPLVRIRAATMLVLWNRRRHSTTSDKFHFQIKLIPLFVKYMKKDAANTTHAIRCEAAEGLGALLQGNEEEVQRVAAWTDGLVLRVFADTWREYNATMPKISQSIASAAAATQQQQGRARAARELTTEEIVTQNLRDVSPGTIEIWRTFLFCFSCLIEQCENNRRMLQSHCTIEELSQRSNPLRHLTAGGGSSSSLLPSSSTPTTALHINDRLLDPIISAIKPGMPEPLVNAALRLMLSLSRSVRQLRTAFCEQLVWIEIICLLKSYYPSIRDAPSRRPSNSSGSQKQQQNSVSAASAAKSSSSGFLSTPSSTLSNSFSTAGFSSGVPRRKMTMLRPDYSWTSPSRRNRLLAASVLCNMLMVPPPKISKLELLRLDVRDVERDERLGNSYAKLSSPKLTTITSQLKPKSSADEVKAIGSGSVGFSIQQLLSAYNDVDQSLQQADDDDEDGCGNDESVIKHANVSANQSSVPPPPSPLSVGSLLRELIEEVHHDRQICLTGVWCLMNLSFGCQTVAEKVSAMQIITPRILEELLLVLHCSNNDDGDEIDDDLMILQCTLGVMRNCIPVDVSSSNNNSGDDTDDSGAKPENASQTMRAIMERFMPLLVAVMKKYSTSSFQPTTVTDTEPQQPFLSSEQQNHHHIDAAGAVVIREQILATLARFADNRYGGQLIMQNSDALDFIRESLTLPAAAAAAAARTPTTTKVTADDTTAYKVQRIAVSCVTLLIRRPSTDEATSGQSSNDAIILNDRRGIFIDRGFARLLYALREQTKAVDTVASRALLEQTRTALFHLNNIGGDSATSHRHSLSLFSAAAKRDDDDEDDDDGPASAEPMHIS